MTKYFSKTFFFSILFCTEQAVSSISKTWNDITVFVQTFIQGCCKDFYIWMSFLWRAFTPSGADTRQTNLIFGASCFLRVYSAKIAATPVAHWVSTIKIWRWSMSSEFHTKYSTGWSVSFTRYTDMSKTLAAGQAFKRPSTIPIPVQEIGTMANFLPANCFWTVFVMCFDFLIF